MPVAQGKVSIFSMIEGKFFPATRRMALLAFFPIAALVYIIGLVAGYARFGCFDITVSNVAGITICFFVFSGVGKFRFFMLVLNFAPAGFIVAGVAAFCDFAHLTFFMRRIILMTA